MVGTELWNLGCKARRTGMQEFVEAATLVRSIITITFDLKSNEKAAVGKHWQRYSNGKPRKRRNGIPLCRLGHPAGMAGRHLLRQ